MKEFLPTTTKCTSCNQISGGVCMMESPDVIITFSQDGTEWAHYLSRCLRHGELPSYADPPDPPSSSSSSSVDGDAGQPILHVHQQALEQLVLPLSKAKIGFFLRSRAHLVVVSPNFLDFVVNNPSVILGELFEPSRVLALMCGVREAEVSSLHRASLAGYDAWHRVSVEENDSECVLRVMTIANELLRPKQPMGKSGGVEADRPLFRLNPCKAREGSAKITIEFIRPVPEGKVISVTINNECEIIPVLAKRYNPYNAKFVVPDRFFGVSQIVHISVTCDLDRFGSKPLKCESKMAQLNQLLQSVNHPLSFVCETLGLSSSRLEDLDRNLVDNFKKNVPKSGFTFLEFSRDVVPQKVDEELPTLLHWAAKMGLRELCAALLDCMGSAEACRIQNCRGLNAADIAEMEGHSCLANMLENYAQLSETAEIYTYMKSIAENSNVDAYENLRAMFCKNPSEMLVGSCPTLERTREKECKVTSAVAAVNDSSNITEKKKESEVDIPQSNVTLLRKHSDASIRSTNMQLYTAGQQELLELLEDFKQDKYSLQEVELLFHNWQMRQKTNSFEEKQEQLKLMRQQYEETQNKGQQDNKRTSTFDKFRSFLARNVKKETNVNRVIKVESVYVRNRSNDSETNLLTIRNKTRPSSTWSGGSSSLSDRSSTMSGISVGSTSDSGALSDIGEENSNSFTKCKNVVPKSLTTPVVNKMVENMQYFDVKDHSQRQLPKTPLLSSKSSPIPVRATKFVSSSRTANFSPDRKPMPPPRLLAGSPSAGPVNDSLEITFAHPAAKSSQSLSISDYPSSSPVDLDSFPPSNCGSPKVELTHYVPMGSLNSTPATSSLALNAAAIIIDETDYYNVCAGPTDYVDMRSHLPTATSAYQPQSTLRVVVDRPPTDNATAVRQQWMRNNDNGDQDDRCDSVPDCPPPAPPVEQILPPTVAPPPVPPRK